MNPLKRPSPHFLFVHVPKFSNHYLPLGEFMNINYMPMGLPALAHMLKSGGTPAEIIHLGVEWILDKSYSVIRELEGRPEITAVGMPLYWHYQSFDVIDVARKIKEVRPDVFLFLGGTTAGYFNREILESVPWIDAVVQGHGETPIRQLNEALAGKRDFRTVSNLVWRDEKGAVHKNPMDYFAEPKDLDDLVFGDLSVMRHPEEYAANFGFPLAWGKDFNKEENRRFQTMGRTFFPLFIGRGCPVVCTYCGGNRDSLRRINGGSKMLWRGHDRVMDDIRRAMDFGYKTMALCFDPIPERDEYYVELFRKMRAARLDVDFYFECWGLPTERFMREFARTFGMQHSYFALSPDSGDEDVRRLNKGHFYSNADLLAVCERLKQHGITMDIFFTIGLPGENLERAMKTKRLIHEMAARFSNIKRLMTWSVQLEPGSPQFERPQDFNMITDRRNFMDFVRSHGGEGADTYSGLGFKILDYFGDERDRGGIHEFTREMQKLKCMDFCFLSPDPRKFVTPEQGRTHCFERRKMIAQRRGEPLPEQPFSGTWDYVDEVRRIAALHPSAPRAVFT
ncbi:MAG: hypothetical protein GMKNLPBB_01789 [Myxococcota bacterium]|nr:hypothetical protein [Myxococcota bacterium]